MGANDIHIIYAKFQTQHVSNKALISVVMLFYKLKKDNSYSFVASAMHICMPIGGFWPKECIRAWACMFGVN